MFSMSCINWRDVLPLTRQLPWIKKNLDTSHRKVLGTFHMLSASNVITMTVVAINCYTPFSWSSNSLTVLRSIVALLFLRKNNIHTCKQKEEWERGYWTKTMTMVQTHTEKHIQFEWKEVTVRWSFFHMKWNIYIHAMIESEQARARGFYADLISAHKRSRFIFDYTLGT